MIYLRYTDDSTLAVWAGETLVGRLVVGPVFEVDERGRSLTPSERVRWIPIANSGHRLSGDFGLPLGEAIKALYV